MDLRQYMTSCGVRFGNYVGEDGTPTRKTKFTNPYDYDPFVIWQSKTKADDTVYSDRLWQWDHKKHDELCQKHFGNRGQYWDQRPAHQIQDFLCDYFGEKVELCRVMEYCNVATGYPCWRFDYKRLEPSEREYKDVQEEAIAEAREG